MPRGMYDRPTYKVVCSVCGAEYSQKRLPIENPRCSKCQKKGNDSTYYLRHIESFKEYAGRDKVKARKLVQNKRYYENNKEVISKRQHDYYVKNRESILSKAEFHRRSLGEKPSGLSGTESKVLSILHDIFPNEIIKEKDRSTIKSPRTGCFLELDFYIPNLRLAVEINGPTHYKPIYGDSKYARQIRNDRIKRFMCKLKGITLIEIPLEEGVHYDRYDSEYKKLRETILRFCVSERISLLLNVLMQTT